MNAKLIAPCGINCSVCLGYLREKNRCPGCRETGGNKPEYCNKCIIRNCQILREKGMKYCSDRCEKYPCKRLKGLDKRYRTGYAASPLENLENVKKYGIRRFIREEKTRWKCKKCEATLCVHRDFCLKCGEKR
jgi:hypothetical protein